MATASAATAASSQPGLAAARDAPIDDSDGIWPHTVHPPTTIAAAPTMVHRATRTAGPRETTSRRGRAAGCRSGDECVAMLDSRQRQVDVSVVPSFRARV